MVPSVSLDLGKKRCADKRLWYQLAGWHHCFILPSVLSPRFRPDFRHFHPILTRQAQE
jgi:hypothetical protein